MIHQLIGERSLIVADHPPPEVMERIRSIVAQAGDDRIGLYDLKQRHNNWGIAPAAAGLRLARGEYLSFLSDDNGYTPDHVDTLVRVLDREPMLGFAYSSCLYDGRLVLSHPVPRPGRIDLGQPMFRRELFELHFDDALPFDMMAWDWHLVDALMRRGVRWRHVDRTGNATEHLVATREGCATVVHADIRGLDTSRQIYVAGLPSL